MSRPLRTFRSVAVPAFLLVLALGGCVESFPDAQVARGDIRDAIAHGTAASPRAASVVIESLDGAPDAVTARFNKALAKEASDREITMADSGSAHYLVRGYLSARGADAGGTEVSYVYDIFDANDRSRVDRVADVLTLSASGGDAWALVNDRVMESLAAHSADDLAKALAATPVARAGLAPKLSASMAAVPSVGPN